MTYQERGVIDDWNTLLPYLTTLSFLTTGLSSYQNKRYIKYFFRHVYDVCVWCFSMDYSWMEYSGL